MDDLARYLDFVHQIIRVDDTSNNPKYVEMVIEEINTIVIEKWVEDGHYQISGSDIRTAKRRAIAKQNGINPN